MDSIKTDNEIIVGDGGSVTEPESAYEKLTDRVKAATSENPILVRWNKRTGTYEVIDKQDWFKNSGE